MRFIVPREPRLSLSLLFGARGNSPLPVPFDTEQVSYFFWARNAIFHGLRALGVSSGDVVLAPAYHCATAIEPIIGSGAAVTFYNVHRDCTPDFDDIRSKITANTRALLAIHYFGFPGPIRELRDLCDRHHLFLIEDCAHVLTGELDGAPLGSFGEIGIFSWRKFFPIHDGGLLVLNKPDLELDVPWDRQTIMLRLKGAKDLVDKLVEDSGSGVIQGAVRFLQLPVKLVRRLMTKTGREPTAVTIDPHSSDFDRSVVNRAMTRLSRRVLRNNDLPRIVEQRRRNYGKLGKLLEAQAGIDLLHPELPAGACPWVFPVTAPGRPKFHMALRSAGLPAAAWDGVVHPALRLEDFPDAGYLYDNLIMLPVHQDIGDEEMLRVQETIARVLDTTPES